MNGEKLKKNNLKKIIVCIVIAMVVAITGLVMYSENVHEIDFIENIKQAIEDMINPNSEVDESNKATVVDVTGITPGDVENHTCSEYYISEYDETYHWNKCKLCGKEYEKAEHSFDDNGWTMGSANYCGEDNVHKYSCNCGYSYTSTIGKKAHNKVFIDNRTQSHQYYYKCNTCGQGFDHHICYKQDGTRIGCANLGVCEGCGYNYTSVSFHGAYYNYRGPIGTTDEDLYCGFQGDGEQGTYLGHVNYSYFEKVSDIQYKWHTSVTVADGVTFKKMTVINEYPGIITVSDNLSRDGNTWTNVQTINIIGHIENEMKLYTRYEGMFKGCSTYIDFYDYDLKADTESPVIDSISQDEDMPWERTKEIVITGTENYCSTVNIEILDGEEVIYEGTASVVDNNWTITAVPEIEADEIGRNFTVRVTDPCENSSTQDVTIAKIDAIAPELAEEKIVLGGDWAKEKSYTFRATDQGIGNVSIAFNDLSKYGVASVDGTIYARKYKFVGDVYEPKEAVVYYKDELGNTTAQTITIDKLDNTAPTIEAATREDKTVTVNAHDRHATEGEGSGIVKYRYMLSRKKLDNPVMTESNSTEIDAVESFVVDDLLPYYYVYLVAIDRAGNVSDVYTIGWESESDVTTIDATGVLPGDVDNHVCSEYYISEYDETYHWNECKICGKVYDKTAHSYHDDGWTMGSASNCNEDNVHKFSCECGYSYNSSDGRTTHNYNYVNISAVERIRGYKCDTCNKEYDVHKCITSDGTPIMCDTYGVCAICGKNWDYFAGHIWTQSEEDLSTGDVKCHSCNNSIGTINSNYIERVNDNTFKYYTNITVPNFTSYYDIRVEFCDMKDVITVTHEPKVDGNIFSDIATITFNKHFEGKGYLGISYIFHHGGGAAYTWITPIKYNICLDEESPVVTSVNQDENTPWEKRKEIVISGTENYCSSVKVEILDGEEVVYTGTTSVTNNNWSITAVPELEADEIGRNFTVRVTDPLENSSTQEFPVKKIDAIAPEITEENIVIGGDWAKEKNYTFGATDDGIGAVSIAFNDLSKYKLAGIDEDGTFERKYRFIGDVYEPREAVVYYKDYLGNTTAQTITIDKLDNTKPTIEEASYSNKIITINAHDRHETEGEGSGIVKYRYITSRDRLDNPEITDSNSTEVAYADSINVGNLSGAKYVYIVAIDRVGNVSNVYEVEIDYELNLNSQVNLEAANGHGGVDLDWTGKNLEDAIYKAYQKKEGSDEWESISTLDYYHEIEPIKVLNLYPIKGYYSTIPTVTFTYTDGTTAKLPKSALLKVWLEGGKLGNEVFEPYAVNPITGQQLLHITPVSSTEFGANPEMIWNYDIVVFGVWNGNGAYDNEQYDKGIDELEQYIKAGYGVLAGHDSISAIHKNIGLSKLRKYFNFDIGRHNDYLTPNYRDYIDYDAQWSYTSTQVKVEKKGLVTNFPYELKEGTILTVPMTDTFSQAAKGNLWMKLVDGTDNSKGSGSIQNYYNAGGTGNAQFYLTTYNNTAVSMAGSALGEGYAITATSDERKVLANTLFYLKQRTKATSFTDNSGQDVKAPNVPELHVNPSSDNELKLTYNSEDNGSTYSYYVQAYDQNDASILLATSNQRTETVTTGTKGYYYIIDENSENTDFDVSAATYVEANEFEIDMSNLGKYVHMKAVDKAGNISEPTVIEIDYDLRLNSKVNLEAANGHGGVDLDWTGKKLEDAVYKAYQKKEGSDEWESISTVDLYDENAEPIKVLNVYPDSMTGKFPIPRVTFTYADGTTVTLPKSAALKVWMEGGTMNENGTITTFESYGKNPITGQQLLEITPVSITDFNNDPDIIWNYDVMMYGSWNGNGHQQINDNATDIVEKYIKEGYGILAGHDTIGWIMYNQGLNKLRKYFNIEVGYHTDDTNYPDNSIDVIATWTYASTQVKVEKNGLLTNFPHELPLGTILTIPITHTCSNAAKGTVWMNLVNGVENYYKGGFLKNYYNAGGTENPVYYLSTYNNTAMIQTGESNCDSTADERKILANTLFYLKQRTKATSFTDNSGQDVKAPNAPELQVTRDVTSNNIKVTFNSEDNGSTYSYYVEAYDQNDASILLATSNQRTETVTTGTKGYYYIVDTDSNNSDFDITKATYTEDENIALDVSNNGKYVHMKAIDKAGNVGAPSVKKIEVKSTVTVKLDGGVLNGNTADTTREESAGTVIDLGLPTKEGFTFAGWEPVEGSVSGNNYTFPIRDDEVVAKWTRNNYGYRVEYYYNDIIDNSMTVTGEAAFDNELNSYEAKVKTGYKFDRVETLPLKITTNPANNVIRVYYVTDDSQKKTLNYSVEYYKGNDKVVADTQVANQSVQYLAPDVLTVNKTDINTTDKYAGYRLDQIRVNDKLVSELPETVNNNDIIKVFFIKRNDLKYTVKHYDVETKQEIHEAQVFENQTFEDVINGSSKAIVIDGYTFGHADPSELAIGADESKNVINVYYSKMTGLTYTVNYLEKGTNKVVYPARTVDGQTFGTTVLSESEKINVDGYNYDSVEKESITIGSDSTKNIINIYYTKRNNLSYVVNYIEKGTTREIATSKAVNNVTFGTEIVSSSEMISIPGFNYDSAEKTSIVIGTGENVINLYYTRRDNLSYKVKYMEKNTTNEIFDEKNVLNVTFGTEVAATAEKIDIDGYVYNSASSDVMTVGVNEAENVLTLYYTRRTDLSYTVNYIEKGTTKNIVPSKTVRNVTFGTVVTSESEKIDIDGYNYDSAEKVSIEVGTGSNVINLYYTKKNDLSYTVNYIEKGTTNVLHEAKTVNGKTFNETVTTSSEVIDIAGYNFDSADKEVLTITTGENIINLFYTKKSDLTYKVNYLEKDTDIILHEQKVVQNKTFGEVITSASEKIDIAGYNYDSVNPESITITAGENVINVYYTKRTDLSYTVNYLEQDSNNKVAESKVVEEQTFLARVTENAIDVEGYDKVNPINQTITIGVSGNIINFYYTKRDDLSYTVNYLEQDTNAVLATAKVVNNQVFKAEIVERAIDINGYDKVQPITQTITIGVNENVINFYYTKKNNLSYKVNYIDKETGHSIRTQKVVENKTFGDVITASDEIVAIDGYNFESTDKTSITIGTGENVINIYYTRRNDLSYTMNFLEKDTNKVLAEPVTVGNLAFETIVSSTGKAIAIEGYNYNSVDKQSITIGTGVNEFNFYYTKRNDLGYTVNYLEKDTNKVLSTAKIIGDQIFEAEVTEEAIDIVGYNKVEPTSKTISIGVSGNVINFYYTKRNDLTYTVNYYEVGTKDKIATTDVIDNVVFETVVDSKKHAKAIDGYNFGHCDPATLTVGVNAEENVIDIYYSRANGLTYTVNYVEKDNEENVLHPAKIQDEQTFGDVVKAADEVISIEGYNYDSVSVDEITIGTDATKNVITIYYTRRNDLSYTVNYLEQGSNEVLATAKVVDKQVFEARVTEEAIEIAGYVKPVVTSQSITIGVSGNVINFYYTKRNDLSYEVNYYEEGTTKKIAETKVVTGQTFKSAVRENAIEIEGYNKLDPTSQTLTIEVEGNEIDFYYRRRNDLSYVVNYLEQGTDRKVVPSKTVNGQTFLTDVTEQAMPVDGYNIVEPASKTITIQVTGNEINFYYTKRNDLSYTVNYLEQGTNEVLSEAKVVGGQTFEAQITETAIDINGYVKPDPDTKTITIDVENNEINFYYTKRNDLSYTVNYLEQGSDIAIATSKTVNRQTFKTEVTEVAIDVDGYNKVEPTSKTINIEVTGNIINFYYTKRSDLSYTVNYLEKDTNNVIHEQKVVPGRTLDEVITTSNEIITIDGYNYDSVNKATLKITTGENIINIYYTKREDLEYRINYLEKDTNKVLKEEKIARNIRFETVIKASDEIVQIDGYNYNSSSKDSIIVGTNFSENVISLYYTKRTDLNYKVNYLEVDTGDILHEQKVVDRQVFGTKITASDEIIDIDGYSFDSVDKTTITVGTSENVINIYYVKKSNLSYTMNYLEKGTNKVLSEPVTVRNQTFGVIVSSNEKAINIEGYNFDSVDKATITIGTGVNEFNFYYTKRNDLSYTVNYLEQGSEKALAEAKVVNNKTFEEEVTENAVDVVGYNKVEPTTKTINIAVTGNVINFYYTKRTDLKYTVNHYEEGTTNAIAPVDTIENVVFETVIDSKTKAKTIDGYTYKSCTPEKLTVGVDDSKNVVNIYYTRVDGLTYTVNYVEKGNESNVLQPAKVVDKQTFGATIDAAKEVISISGYIYDSVSADSIVIGTDLSKNVITVYYTRRNDLSYTVNYLEQGSNEVLATAKVVDKQVYEAKVTEEAIDISGYVKPVVTSQTITIGVEGNVINFYYTKRNDLSYVVNYYEEGTTKEIAETKTVTGQTYKAAVRENAIEISGYNKLDPTSQTITIEVEENEINFYYRRRNDLTYVVNYLEEGTNKKVVPSKTVNGQTYLTDVTEQAMPVDGYVAVEPTSKTITIQVEGNEFNFYYTKRTDLSYTVNYLEQGSNEVLATAKVVNGQTYEAEVTEEAIDIAGYNKVEPQRQSIIIDVENNVINFYYTKRTDLSYTVNYLEKNTDKVIAPAKVVGKQTYKATATEQAIEIDGYDKLDPTEKSITIEVENNVINFYYTKKDDLNYKVNYLEKDTNKIIHDQKVATGRIFDEVIIARDEVIEIDGYNYSSVDKQSITIGTGENVINVYYTKRNDLRYTINYLEKDSNVVLKAQKIVNNVVFDTEVTINAEKVDIDGYVFDSASPENFKVSTNADANVMNIYYTRRGDLSYKVNYLDVETGDILHEQKVVGEQVLGNRINANDEIIEIDGYNFDSFDKTTITIGTSENVINIYYIKRNDLSYTINFLEKDTNEVLAEPVVVRNQVFGATISSNGKAIAINGYNYHSADKRTITIGTNEEENVFNLYYTKHTDLKYKVNYIERETDKVLAEQKVVSNRTFGEIIVSETEAISIDGYSFDGCDKETLTIGTGENVITVYYTKVNGLSYTVKYIDRDTNETIHAPKTVGEQTFGDTILARNERINIDGYVYDSCSRDRLPITTGVNELTLYYIKRSDLNYKINYIEKGTGNTIKDTKTVNGMTYKDEVYAEDELIDIDGYYFDSYDKEKIIIGTRENVINMYYTRRTDLSYVVNYLEKGTNKEITGSKTVVNMNFGDVVESKNDVIEVYGYKFDSADKETLTITTGENVINLYYIKKDTKVTVHYYEENSTTKVSNDVVISGKVFDRYEAIAAEDVASKYELVGTPDNSIGKMTEEEIVVTFYYRKKATKVIVHFYEEGTTNKLSENVVIEGRVDDAYTTKAAEDVPIKYELVGEPSNKNGSMTEEIIEVTYFYRVKDTYLNIRYLEKGTNIELATPERQNGKVEEDYITDAKVIEGYTLVEDSGNTTGKLTIAPITVTFYYLQNTSVEVNHIDKNTDEVLEKVTVDGLVGDKYTANAKDIANYVLVERPRVETVTMSKDKITLNYYYVHVSAGVIEKHVDVITGDILANAIHEGNEGDAYNIPSRTFEGYDLVREKMPSNARGTMEINPIEVTYYYKYRSSVTAEYIDTITNRKLASDIVINGYEADSYVTERKEFDGYKLVEVPANSEGKMTKAPIKVTYRYVHESAGVEVKHIDIKTGKELVKAELIPGYEADEYTTKPQNIPGYDLIKDRIPTNAEGKMTIDKIIVEYYYIKQSSVTAKYIDKITGDEIEEEVLIEGHEGDKYETEAKEIEGYDLAEVPENAEGIMGADPSEVIYEYHRPAKVIINYIDVDTNEEITEPEVIEGHQDDPYETEAKEIKYYNLVEDKLPKNAKGKMTVNVTKDKKKELVDDETIVNYYYKKMEFSIKVDKIIDRVILNGNTLNINGDVGKIEISKKELSNAKLQIIYKIRVINNGELAGKATLLEKLPSGTTMSKADNQLWEISGATATMTTEEIKPGETKEYTVILDWANSEGNVGNKENKVDVLKTENEAGFDEAKVDLEDSNADLVISISTGSSTYIIATGVAMVVLAGISIVLVKKTKEE